ncbi:hypothetical protein SDC9_136000 [bioreactor metagenome]|uniref:7TM-DISM receptor extracellular domain-containing protein n=1 Tax=bioreactor metagenome TaxID=1076179 RepID=A0A645DHV1_9ZZZZ
MSDSGDFSLLVDSIYAPGAPVRVKYGYLAYGATTTLLTAGLPIRIYTAAISLLEAAGIAIVDYSVVVLIKLYMKGERGSALILISVVVILLTGVHDVLYQANVIHHMSGELTSFGVFIFMFTFSYTIAHRLSDAYHSGCWRTRA